MKSLMKQNQNQKRVAPNIHTKIEGGASRVLHRQQHPKLQNQAKQQEHCTTKTSLVSHKQQQTHKKWSVAQISTHIGTRNHDQTTIVS